jgi:hypothetical protein
VLGKVSAPQGGYAVCAGIEIAMAMGSEMQQEYLDSHKTVSGGHAIVSLHAGPSSSLVDSEVG